MFKDSKEGETQYCRRCVMEEWMKENPGHTCGIPASLREEMDKPGVWTKICDTIPPNAQRTCTGLDCPEPQDWEIGLTQLISNTWKKGLWHSESNMMIDLKSFITSLLHSERERVVESIKQLPDTYEDDESRVFRTTIKEVLEKIDVE